MANSKVNTASGVPASDVNVEQSAPVAKTQATQGAKKKINLQQLSARELLDYREFAEILCGFYDNEMKANTGEYDTDRAEIFKAASQALAKYLALKENIFFEIKRRADEVL